MSPRSARRAEGRRRPDACTGPLHRPPAPTLVRPRPRAALLIAALGGCVSPTVARVPSVAPGAAGEARLASLIEHDSAVAVRMPGPHGGGGETTAFPFFRDAPVLDLVFRKRVLHPGSAIGHHEQREDEIYYVLSGRGELTLNGTRREIGPGTATLTRTGSSHALKPLGDADLVILMCYLRPAATR